MRHSLYNCSKHFVDALTGFTRRAQNILTFASNKLYNLILHLVWHCARHVYLVEHGDNFQIVLDSHIEVRDSLCLHTLCSIDYE